MLVRKTELTRLTRVIAKQNTAWWYNNGENWYISDSHFVLQCSKDVFDYMKKQLDSRKKKVKWKELPLCGTFFENMDGILVRDRKPGTLPDKREVIVLEQSQYKVVIDKEFVVKTDGQYLFYTTDHNKPVYQLIGEDWQNYEMINMILPIYKPEVTFD